ncbi:MAG: hypothetical protein BWY85_01985 [Firmicutes bacterium ADurb.Bin506]|jgi:hypothetical protein|nr:MAG: hypothetical protein BWY85_01985 [Firmicutes bacterium ADurb.Bin506]
MELTREFKEKFVRSLSGREFILYGGVLQLAKGRGLKRITTRIVQVPDADNGHLAVCEAEVETTDGVFSDVGDASPSSVSRTIQPHLLRMAATRAKARAMRDAVGIEMVALEELGGDSTEDFEDVDAVPEEFARGPESPAAVGSTPTPAASRTAGTSPSIRFGKYAGRSLDEIWQVDPGYVEWLARNAHEESVRAAAAAYSRNLV